MTPIDAVLAARAVWRAARTTDARAAALAAYLDAQRHAIAQGYSRDAIAWTVMAHVKLAAPDPSRPCDTDGCTRGRNHEGRCVIAEPPPPKRTRKGAK